MIRILTTVGFLLNTILACCQDPVKEVIPTIKENGGQEKEESIDFTTQNWLRDGLTVDFRRSQIFNVTKRNKLGTNYAFAGIRLIFEPQFGNIFQRGSNRLKQTTINAIPKFGLETNLIGGWLSIQGFAVFATGSISFDEQSTVVKQHLLLNPDGTSSNTADIDYGYGLGISCLDGIFAIGWGNMIFDSRNYDKTNASYNDSFLANGYIYFNIQAISAVRKVIKNKKED